MIRSASRREGQAWRVEEGSYVDGSVTERLRDRDVLGLKMPPPLDLYESGDSIEVVPTNAGFALELHFAHVATYTLVEIDALALDGPGGTVVFADRAKRTVGHPSDTEGREHGCDRERGAQRAQIPTVEPGNDGTRDQNRARDNP